jgi:hypothetical protein
MYNTLSPNLALVAAAQIDQHNSVNAAAQFGSKTWKDCKAQKSIRLLGRST